MTAPAESTLHSIMAVGIAARSQTEQTPLPPNAGEPSRARSGSGAGFTYFTSAAIASATKRTTPSISS